MSADLYVQYGCGWDVAPGWLNFDASPTLRIERIPVIGKSISSIVKRNRAIFPKEVRYGDIVKGLPLPAHSCCGIYCSHILEHLSLCDFRLALTNTINLLCHKGIFRLVVPDLLFLATRYIQNSGSTAAPEFIRDTGLGEESRGRGFMNAILQKFGNSKHRWMWDYSSLEEELKNAGFIEIRRAQYHDSSDQKFNEVEREDRWTNCLGIECKCM